MFSKGKMFNIGILFLEPIRIVVRMNIVVSLCEIGSFNENSHICLGRSCTERTPNAWHTSTKQVTHFAR